MIYDMPIRHMTMIDSTGLVRSGVEVTFGLHITRPVRLAHRYTAKMTALPTTDTGCARPRAIAWRGVRFRFTH